MANADTVFTGRIPELYDRLMGPMVFRPYAADIARRLQGMQAGHVLETAAGTGIVTRAMAAALPPSVAITATDLNPDMLAFAAAMPGTARVQWQPADAQHLPFPDASFDAVVCQFGLMFFPDQAAGHAEAWRVLKPGGRYLASVWSSLDRNPIPRTLTQALADLFPADPPLFMARTPHGHDDIPRISAALATAGFADIRAERCQERSPAASPRAAAAALCQGTPLRNEILARDPAGLDRATDHAARAVAAAFTGGDPDKGFDAPMEAILFTAARPGCSAGMA